ncbi:MAG TPA: LegC family aminotransferase [Puia sp.]|nr:LegC family aminotransferase [Puia sp.]
MIPLSVPNISGNEWKYIKDCLDTNWVSSVGSYVSQFEKISAEFCGVKYAVATSNGTSAIHVSLLLAGVNAGDLVIAPNITFVAPLNAIKYIHADPLLIDVDAHTWQMDLNLLEKFLQEETSVEKNSCIHRKSAKKIAALMPVHVLGNMCDMDRLLKIASAYHLAVIEDATEALGSFYNDKHAGSFGKFGCLSFNGNKIITTGGGGMILTDDEALAKKAKHITTQAKAKPDEYYHDDIGYNYRLVNILAAMGVAQMEQLPAFIKRKKEIAALYNQAFKNIKGFQPQQMGEHVNSNHWLYTAKVEQQSALRKFLWDEGLEVRPFWVPMNQLPAFKNNLYYQLNDVSNEIYKNCLSLPCSTNLPTEDQNKVVDLVLGFYKKEDVKANSHAEK